MSHPSANPYPAGIAVRHALLLLLLASLLPMLAGGGWILMSQWHNERENVDVQLQAQAQSLSAGLDREFAVVLGRLQSAAASELITREDWSGFHSYAQRVLADWPGALLAITASDGQLLVNSAVPPGQALPNVWKLEARGEELPWHGQRLPLSSQGITRRVFETGQPQYSNLYMAVSLHRPTLAVALPAGPRHAITMSFPPDALEALLRRTAKGEGVRAYIADRNGIVVATNGRTAVQAGEPARDPGVGADATQAGAVFDRRSRDEVDLVGAWSRSEASGFHAVVAMPRQQAYAAAVDSLRAWALTVGVVLLLGGGVTALVAQRLRRGLADLARLAALEGDEPVASRPARLGWPGRTVSEIDVAARSLLDARRLEAGRREALLARRLAEEQHAQMAANEERLRRLVDNLFAFVGVLDDQGRLIEVNRAPLQVAALRRDDVVGRPFHDCFWWSYDPAVAAEVHDAVRRALAGETVRYDVPIRVAGDERRVIDFQVGPLRDAQGRIAHAVASGVDITERVTIERELREADRQKDLFIATLAHELLNPLAPIRASAEILRLRGAEDAATVARCADVVLRQSRQLACLIDDLLEGSRIRVGAVTLNRRTIDLREVVQGAVEAVRPTLQAAAQPLRLDLPDAPVLLAVDAARLTQVVANLLGNASKFSPRGAPIRLSLSATPTHVALVVDDQGCGIEPANLERIFELFAQERPSGTAGHGGLGIGLALARNLVELHGGLISASSEGRGQGSRFTVLLPLQEKVAPAVPADAAEPPIGSEPAGSPLSVLLVDDNEDAAATLAELLQWHGHRVETAATGEQALARWQAEPRPQVLILDIGLPDIDGHLLARRIRATQGSAAPLLIALTGWGQPHDRARASAAGFDHHFTKPVDAQVLLALLARSSIGAAA